MATLAWDLAERLKFGIALGITYLKSCDWQLEDGPNLSLGWSGWASRESYLEREGCRVGIENVSALSHFLSRKDRRPSEAMTYSRYLAENYPETSKLLEQLWRQYCDQVIQRHRASGIGHRESLRLFDADDLFCARNVMIHDGSPFFLRNNEFKWYSEFSRQVINRFSIRATDRWLAVRDKTNNLVVADKTPTFEKIDYWFAEVMRGKCDDPRAEHYDVRDKDAEPQKIAGVRGTCRKQDDHALRWFHSKGLHWNPYTEWLDGLVQLREKSTALIDWTEVKEKARRYVPARPEPNHESRFAQLYWCLSRDNPKKYRYRSPFTSNQRAEGEAALLNWWKRVSSDAAAAHPKNGKKY